MLNYNKNHVSHDGTKNSPHDNVEGHNLKVKEIEKSKNIDDIGGPSAAAFRKKSFAAVLFENFSVKNELAKQNDISHTLNTHLDNSDLAEKKRQENEIQKETSHSNDLAHKVVESYKELMSIKDRFEYERLSVQRAEVKRFLCNIFHDIDAILEEKKSQQGILGNIGDFLYSSIPTFSTPTAKDKKEDKSVSEVQSQSDKSSYESENDDDDCTVLTGGVISDSKSKTEEAQCAIN